MLCLDVLWGAPASVPGCPGSEGTAALMLSVLELLVLGTAPVLATVPQMSPAGHTRGDRALGLPQCWQAVEHRCGCGAEHSAAP